MKIPKSSRNISTTKQHYCGRTCHKKVEMYFMASVSSIVFSQKAKRCKSKNVLFLFSLVNHIRQPFNAMERLRICTESTWRGRVFLFISLRWPLLSFTKKPKTHPAWLPILEPCTTAVLLRFQLSKSSPFILPTLYRKKIRFPIGLRAQLGSIIAKLDSLWL